MQSFFLICLMVLALLPQRLAADDVTALPSRVPTGKVPLTPPWTFAQITNLLREVELTWEQSPGVHDTQIHKVARSRPDEPHAFKMLFEGISKLPLLSPETDAEERIYQVCSKWRTLSVLADSLSLHNDPETWETLASMVGEVRQQIIPDYQRHVMPRYDMNMRLPGETEQQRQERLTRLKEEVQKAYESSYQDSLRDVAKSWTRITINRVCHLAVKMPPDERKQFLDKIKELARSDEEEAKLVEETMAQVRPGIPVTYARSHASRLTPVARKQFLDMAKKEADYTKKELEILDAPYE